MSAPERGVLPRWHLDSWYAAHGLLVCPVFPRLFMNVD